MPSLLQPRAVLATAILSALVLVPVSTASGAPGDQSTFADESFANSTAPGFLAPALSSGDNVACLTAGTDPNATPIPGCAVDAAGAGVLRLTDTLPGQTGGVGSTASVPISKGLDVSFNSYQWGGTSADGIAFYLAATDPFSPEVPSTLGALGGSLGYGAQGSTAGLANGYLGIGLDWYGNFVAPGFGGTGCDESTGRTPNSINVRGPGNGTENYCVLSASPVDGLLRGSGDRASSVVPVEVVINPSTEIITARENDAITVAPGTYAVIIQPIGAAVQTFARPLPSLNNGLLPAGLYDPSWIDPSTGYPYKLTFGWTGGTGGQHDYHEIGDVLATTALGATPAFEVSITGETVIAPTRSSSVVISSSLSAVDGSEDESVIATTTFPNGFAPTLATNTGWTCSISGQVETCTHVPAATIQPGDDLPTLSLPYVVSAGATDGSIDTVVSSVDASSATDSLAVAVVLDPTETEGSASQQPGTTGASTNFTAVVDSPIEAASGTVTVTDSRTDTVICVGTLVAASTGTTATAVCTAEFPDGAVASDIEFTYSGDVDHAVSTDSLDEITIVATATSVTLSVELGDDGLVTFEATGLPATATGTIAFVTSSGEILCSATLPITSCSSTLSDGNYTVTAQYSGDAAFAPSTDDASFTVGEAAPPTPVDGQPAEPGDGLALTGVAVGAAIYVAFGLLIAGLVLLIPAFRRSSRIARR